MQRQKFTLGKKNEKKKITMKHFKTILIFLIWIAFSFLVPRLVIPNEYSDRLVKHVIALEGKQNQMRGEEIIKILREWGIGPKLQSFSPSEKEIYQNIIVSFPGKGKWHYDLRDRK